MATRVGLTGEFESGTEMPVRAYLELTAYRRLATVFEAYNRGWRGVENVICVHHARSRSSCTFMLRACHALQTCLCNKMKQRLGTGVRRAQQKHDDQARHKA